MDHMISLLSSEQITALEQAYGTVEAWFVSLGEISADAYETIIVDLII